MKNGTRSMDWEKADNMMSVVAAVLTLGIYPAYRVINSRRQQRKKEREILKAIPHLQDRVSVLEQGYTNILAIATRSADKLEEIDQLLQTLLESVLNDQTPHWNYQHPPRKKKRDKYVPKKKKISGESHEQVND